MSYPTFQLPTPSAGGSWQWPIKKTPRFATITQTPASLRGQLRLSLAPYPVWSFDYDVSYLFGHEGDYANGTTSGIGQLVGFFAAVQGAGGSFLFTDPFDSTVTAANFGTGDGTTTAFPLKRQLGSFSGFVGWDLIQNVVGSPSVYVGGVLTTPASISSTGVVTFTSAPVNGAALTWTGSFQFLCHFLDDTWEDLAELQTMDTRGNLWTLPKLRFESILQ